ncbi:hypothetical protein A2U01_0059894, partial [Trifolium medium]|nr:hypothetical protein [Trifolium medium]
VDQMVFDCVVIVIRARCDIIASRHDNETGRGRILPSQTPIKFGYPQTRLKSQRG